MRVKRVTVPVQEKVEITMSLNDAYKLKKVLQLWTQRMYPLSLEAVADDLRHELVKMLPDER